MGFFGKLIDILVPPVCTVCGKPGTQGKELCDACREKFVRECFEHCEICSKTAARCTCGTGFSDITRRTIGGRTSFSLTFYKSERKFGESGRVTEKMIFALKERGAFADLFARELSRGLAPIFSEDGEDVTKWTVTYPPRSTENFVKYGVDQSEEIAVKLAKILGCRAKRTMLRGGRSSEQKTLSAAQRRENAGSTLVPIRRNIDEGGKYILLDDIITSGSTVRAAAEILYSCGAAAVFPVSVARDMQTRGNKRSE